MKEMMGVFSFMDFRPTQMGMGGLLSCVYMGNEVDLMESRVDDDERSKRWSSFTAHGYQRTALG